MEVHKMAVARGLALLNSAGCKYCILETDGTKHGALQVVVEKERARRGPRFGRGALKAHFLPLVMDMKAGDAVLVPYGAFGADDEGKAALRGSLSSWCSDRWGSKTHITHNNANGVELLRVC